jgi:hypothetical protein
LSAAPLHSIGVTRKQDSEMKELPPPDQRFLYAAEGWLGLGDHLSVNEELENITPELRTHPKMLLVRLDVYHDGGALWFQSETRRACRLRLFHLASILAFIERCYANALGFVYFHCAGQFFVE